MRIDALSPTRICPLLFTTGLTLVLAIGASMPAWAQEQTPEELVLQYGPNPNVFPAHVLEQTVEGWKWQVEVAKRQQQIIAQTERQWHAKLSEATSDMASLRRKLASAGLTYPVDVRSVQQIDEEIRALESELVGLSAEIKQLKRQSNQSMRQLQFERETMANELAMMQQKLNLAMKEHERTKQLYEKKAIPEHAITESQVNVVEMQSKVANVKNKLQLIEQQLAEGEASSIAVVTHRQAAIEQTLNDLKQKRDLLNHLQPVQKMNELQSRIDMAQQIIEMAQVRKFEIELDSTRTQAMIELAEEQLGQSDSSPESDQASLSNDK